MQKQYTGRQVLISARVSDYTLRDMKIAALQENKSVTQFFAEWCDEYLAKRKSQNVQAA